jgi:hypothetical protein
MLNTVTHEPGDSNQYNNNLLAAKLSKNVPRRFESQLLPDNIEIPGKEAQKAIED